MSELINKLHQNVTPKVLELTKQEAGSDEGKKDVLGILYAFVAARLSSVQDAVTTHTSGLSLLNALNEGNPSTQGFLAALKDAALTKFNLPAKTVDALTEQGLPLTVDEIKAHQAGVTDVDAEQNSYLSSLPTWAVPLLPATLFGLGTKSAAAAPTNPIQAKISEPVTPAAAPEGVLRKEEKPEGSAAKAILPIVGAIILALLAWWALRACQNNPEPVAAPAPVAAVTETAEEAAPVAALNPSKFAIALDASGQNIFACHGEVGAQALADSLAQATGALGNNGVCNFVVLPSYYEADAPIHAHIADVLGAIGGIPHASLSVVGHSVLVNASNEGDVAKLIEAVKGVLPAEFNVEAEPVLNEAEAISASLLAADSALAALLPTSPAEELVHALNLQIINFAFDSYEIPEENKAILDRAAELLQQMPNAHLQITGHTDNQGSMDYNTKLSQDRAQAVHDYLVSKGVNDDKLEVLGDSYNHPIASNETEQGRFHNRRIEFSIFNHGNLLDSVGSADSQNALVGTNHDANAPDVLVIESVDGVAIEAETAQ